MNTTAAASTAGKARIAWLVTLALFTGLLLMLAVDHTLLRPVLRWPVWAMQSLPLLLVLPGLLKRHYRSGIWLCFMILFHFLLAVDNVVMSGHAAFYSCMAALIVLLFIASMLFARWQARA